MHIYIQKKCTPESTADSKSGVYDFYTTVYKKDYTPIIFWEFHTDSSSVYEFAQQYRENMYTPEKNANKNTIHQK